MYNYLLFQSVLQIEYSAVIAQHEESMRNQQRRSPFQLSMGSTVSMGNRSNLFPFQIVQCELVFINFGSASIFAYGQTSSGKTYTMSGITEYSIADIYDYIQKVLNCLKIPTCFFLMKISKCSWYFVLFSSYFKAWWAIICFEILCNGDLQWSSPRSSQPRFCSP